MGDTGCSGAYSTIHFLDILREGAQKQHQFALGFPGRSQHRGFETFTAARQRNLPFRRGKFVGDEPHSLIYVEAGVTVKSTAHGQVVVVAERSERGDYLLLVETGSSSRSRVFKLRDILVAKGGDKTGSTTDNNTENGSCERDRHHSQYGWSSNVFQQTRGTWKGGVRSGCFEEQRWDSSPLRNLLSSERRGFGGLS